MDTYIWISNFYIICTTILKGKVIICGSITLTVLKEAVCISAEPLTNPTPTPALSAGKWIGYSEIWHLLFCPEANLKFINWNSVVKLSGLLARPTRRLGWQTRNFLW